MTKEPKKLNELFHDTLKDIYFAEKRILAALPKMAKAAQSEELRAAFEKHRGETEEQIERLEQVFGIIEKKPQGKTCAAIVGITDEGAEIMQEYKGSTALDAACSRPLRLSSTMKSPGTELCARGPRSWVLLMRPPFCKKPLKKRKRPTKH
jgi:hypothetical protein